jgi:hypothetical protein
MQESLSVEEDKPELQMYRRTPEELLLRPPLASSLQSFESSVELIALGRFPHAFTSCAFAIESALKAAYRLAPGGGEGLQTLLDRARRDLPDIARFREPDIDNLRRTRNRIVHYGFSPKDDRITATILLDCAIPLLASAYGGFFKFDLYDGLIWEFGIQLRHALAVYDRFRTQPDLDPSHCLVVFAHQVRWSMKGWFMADWEQEAADEAESGMLKFELVERKRAKVESALDPAWWFDCPVCSGIRSFVCQLVDSALDSRTISLSRGICLDCGLVIPSGTPWLADVVCQKQIEDERVKILKDFGLE